MIWLIIKIIAFFAVLVFKMSNHLSITPKLVYFYFRKYAKLKFPAKINASLKTTVTERGKGGIRVYFIYNFHIDVQSAPKNITTYFSSMNVS